MNRKVIIGSRGSDLALWQARHVTRLLEAINVPSEIKIIKTQGDRIQHLSFDKMEGKGFFTKEIEAALLDKSIDLAVHSHKDLETTPPEGLKIAAVSEREDPADILIIRKEAVDLKETFRLKKDAIVGTSSARRKSQLLAFRPDISLKDLRGNVPTRVQKLRDGQYDAIVGAFAAVTRLELDLEKEFYVYKFNTKEFIPAPAQGVLALQIRENDDELTEVLQKINDEEVEHCIGVERRILNLLDGGCQLPLGAYCIHENNVFKVWASKADAWNAVPKRVQLVAGNPEGMAEKVIEKLKEPHAEKVFITRDLDEENYFYRVLSASGYAVCGESLIDTQQVRFSAIPDAEWVFFSSKNAVKHFFDQDPSLKEEVKFGVIGPGTERALNEHGREAIFVGSKKETDTIGKDFEKLAKGQRVLFPQARKSLRSVQQQLNFAAKVVDLYVYDTVLKKEVRVPEADIIVFTSPSNVKAFFENSRLNDRQQVVAIGTTTAKQLEEYKVKNISIAEQPTEPGLVDAVFSC